MNPSSTLLSRDEFRQSVFDRDGHLCVICKNEAQDAHHILERRLWDNEGYYLDNGASLCPKCHILAEQTVLSCEEIRIAAGINKIMIPDDMGYDEIYDKWGNPILPNGKRVKGELFFDESVQKVLASADMLGVFMDYVKYPKTNHCPWSEGLGKGDRRYTTEQMKDYFDGKKIIVTEKLDGECSSLYTNYMHARSIDGRSHPSRNWLKNFHATIASEIPDGWRICGENVFARHSISYCNLPSFFFAFAIFDEKNTCLDFDSFTEWCGLLGIEQTPILYRGIYDEEAIKRCYTGASKFEGSEAQEGYVARVSGKIPFSNYRRSIFKFVRENHVQTNANWMFQKITPNLLAKG